MERVMDGRPEARRMARACIVITLIAGLLALQ